MPVFTEITKTLHKDTMGQEDEIKWTPEMNMAFKTSIKALLESPDLAFPYIHKHFLLYIDERKEIAKGVLTKTFGPWKRPVAYLSKKLDLAAQE